MTKLEKLNKKFPVGTRVHFYPILRDKKRRKEVVTKSEIFKSASGELVLFVEGVSGFVCATNIMRIENATNG